MKKRKERPQEKPRDQGLLYSVRAFKHRNFTIFWLGALVSNTGGWLSNLAVPFVLYQITGSAIWVGFASIAQFVPSILLAPWGGSLADRYDRRIVLILTQIGMAVSAVLLWVVWRAGIHEPLLLLVLIALIGSFGGINMPSWQSFVSDLVPRNDLFSAVSLNSLQFNAARAIGPALAGVLLGLYGASWAFFFNAVSFLFVIGALLVMKMPRHLPVKTPRTSVGKQLVEAMRYVRKQPGIELGIVLSVIVGILGNPLFALTVVFAEEIYNVGARETGILNAALGLGAILIAPLVGGWSKYLPTSKVVLWGMIFYGLFIAAFGANTSYWLGLVILTCTGAAFLAVFSGINTSIQLIVADHMRGRVMSVRYIFYTVSFPVGAILQSWLADLFGVQLPLIIAGCVMSLSVVVIAVFNRRISFSHLDDPHDGDSSVALESQSVTVPTNGTS